MLAKCWLAMWIYQYSVSLWHALLGPPSRLFLRSWQILAQPESDEFRGSKDLANKILAYYMMSLKGVSKKVGKYHGECVRVQQATKGRHWDNIELFQW